MSATFANVLQLPITFKEFSFISALTFEVLNASLFNPNCSGNCFYIAAVTSYCPNNRSQSVSTLSVANLGIS